MFYVESVSKEIGCGFLLVGFWMFLCGVRCSSMVRAFTHSAMGHWIDPSWCTHLATSRSSQCSTTGVTKVMVCIILSIGWCI